ncbi:hypothetical protein PENTCL1PPCAC_21411, partial [Pristionchus entomophagus]
SNTIRSSLHNTASDVERTISPVLATPLPTPSRPNLSRNQPSIIFGPSAAPRNQAPPLSPHQHHPPTPPPDASSLALPPPAHHPPTHPSDALTTSTSGAAHSWLPRPTLVDDQQPGSSGFSGSGGRRKQTARKRTGATPLHALAAM